VVNVEDDINQQRRANPAITPAQLDTYFNNLYQDLAGNPAISGLTLQVHWDTLNPNPPTAANAYDWSSVDDAFAQAAAWSGQNPAQTPKTIQLIVTPGFQTPQWVLDQIPSCDGLFQSPSQTPPSTCGKATFVGYSEGGDSTELPLPWDPLYKSSWKPFLTAQAARYGSNPAFVSIAVAGPTAASAEMLLPNNGNTPPQTQFGGLMPTAMWRQLLAFHYAGMAAYQNSDQAFIDEWNAAIDMYGQVFSGVTLVATTGNGLPDFSTNFTIPTAFSADCGTPNMDCAAETTILSHFVASTAGGANAKATQTSGMEASRGGIVDLGVAGVKRLSQSTAQLTAPSAQILGGAQFNTSFSNDPLGEGCTSAFPPNASDTPAGCSIPPTCTVQGCLPVACIPQVCLAPGVTQANLASFTTFSKVPSQDLIPPEQAEYNVLNVYFGGTAVASTFGGAQGTAPLNYLQIYSPDIQYAEAHANAPAQVVETGGATVALSAQDLLNLASQKLLLIGEPALPPPAAPTLTTGTLANGATYASGGLVPGSWAQVKGTGLSSVTRSWGSSDFTGLGNNLPTKLSGVQVNVNNLPAAVYYIDSGQVSFQVPTGVSGSASVQVINNGVASNTLTAAAATNAPGIFPVIVNGTNYPAGVFPDGTYVGDPSIGPAFRQAKPGDVLQLFATGLAPTPGGVLPTPQAVSGVTVTVGNITVPADFAGLVAVGEFQINFTVPQQFATLAAGSYPISIQVNGASSPVTINSNPPGPLVLPVQH